MADDLERLNRLLDDLGMERDPRDRGSLSADEIELAETAAFLKAASVERSTPDAAFLERLAQEMAVAQAADEAPPSAPSEGLSRRRLMGRLATAAAGLAVGAGAADVLRGQVDTAAAATEKAKAYQRGVNDGAKQATEEPFWTPMVPDDRGEWVKAPFSVSEVAPGAAKRVRVGAVEGFLVNPGGGRAIYAVAAACTHMGCMVSWLAGANTFLCPCHGAQYNADGSVLSGIARHPLPRLRLKFGRDGAIYIWTVSEHPTITTLAPYKQF